MVSWRETSGAHRRGSRVLGLGLRLASLVLVASAAAWSQPIRGEPVAVDATVARDWAPELGGVGSPRFVFARELAFEARLEALADSAFTPSDAAAYRELHLRTALERHVTESILESLSVTPAPTAQEIDARLKAAQLALAQRVGGAAAINRAAAAEGLALREVFRILQRQARASLYLDRMVAPMLDPTEAELRAVHQMGRTPYSRRAYEEVEVELRRWYTSRRLRQAVLDYFEGARERLHLELLTPLVLDAAP